MVGHAPASGRCAKTDGGEKVINDAGRILNEKQQEVLEFRYPFDRYFMNEYRIREAEERLGRIRSDTLLKAWAEIRVKHGQAVITALKLNGENIGQRQKALPSGGNARKYNLLASLRLVTLPILYEIESGTNRHPH